MFKEFSALCVFAKYVLLFVNPLQRTGTVLVYI
jgi:hypothetical protein